ncbi:TetR/AcrR family transcriptional regulator [Jatrophihabitans lederbergiae]|uniref:Helix-turn-helix domain-containing protein n=1 Tax=Jatrophihabitans lederbergiae TaxID=3075547 RepID=A0ABU2JGS0_9ACTN|nr:helix-turn-helix domain-containing protein [Jatrophihabitans sp. DSM 44399]MDT0263889.1 helix-turn-helix domain-containing protein [Jatrophihabitans sp. DSM 44399]
MPRSGAQARDRLERAALELYTEHGYDQTTIADIAAKAGVTQRTFFRHFTDKREVLFNNEGRQQEALTQALDGVPRTLTPVAAMLQAFRSMSPSLENNRPLAEVRHQIIAVTPALRERELMKEAALSTIVADALRERGLAEWNATLLAHVGTTAWGHAIHTWAADPSSNVDALIVQAFADLQDFATANTTAHPATQV